MVNRPLYIYVEYPLRTGAPSSIIRLRGRPSSTAPYSRVVGEMTYPYDCMGHNRSILSANDVDIPPIDGAIVIVLLRCVEAEISSSKLFVVIF